MYRNNGNGTFSDVTVATGTNATGMIEDPVFCGIFFDYNGDGHQDIYMAIDRPTFPNRLLKNNGDGTFDDVTTASGAGVMLDAMNVGPGDYDNDGDIDIYVTNTPAGNALLKNNGDGTFSDVATSTGTIFNRVGWGANFYDFDNDLDLDLFM